MPALPGRKGFPSKVEAMKIQQIGLTLIVQLAVLLAYYSLRFPLLPRELGEGLLGKLTFNFLIPVLVASAAAHYLVLNRKSSLGLVDVALVAGASILAFLAQVALLYVSCMTGACI